MITLPKTNHMKNTHIFLFWFTVVILLTGCTAGNHSLTTNQVYVHSVKWPNETMAKIALWYTGNTDNWIEISRLNRNCDPSRLKRECLIRIPKDLMVKFEPMPKKFVSSCPDSRKKSLHSEKIAKKQDNVVNENQADDIPLFGPR